MIKTYEIVGTFQEPDVGPKLQEFFDTEFTPGRQMLLDVDYSVENVLMKVDGKTARRTVSSVVVVYSEEQGNRLVTEDYNGNEYLLEFNVEEFKGSLKQTQTAYQIDNFIKAHNSDDYVYVNTLYKTVSQKLRDETVIMSNCLFVYARRVNA